VEPQILGAAQSSQLLQVIGGTRVHRARIAHDADGQTALAPIRGDGLSQRVDAIILVIRSSKTTKQALRRSRDILMQVNARITGVLLNAVDLTSPDYYYYYEYQGKYHDSYYREDGDPEEAAADRSAGD